MKCRKSLYFPSELHIYLEYELGCAKWSQFCVNRAYKNNGKGLELMSNSSFNFRQLGKECVKISYFDFDLKNNIVILWTGENGIKTVYDLQSYWTSMYGRHLGFAFLIDRMTEVLTPDIYIELTVFAYFVFQLMTCKSTSNVVLT